MTRANEKLSREDVPRPIGVLWIPFDCITMNESTEIECEHKGLCVVLLQLAAMAIMP